MYAMIRSIEATRYQAGGVGHVSELRTGYINFLAMIT